MAVFTAVSRPQLERWLRDSYDLGGLLAFEGIRTGIENSNFFVDTARGRYVLTLFERLSAAELPFYLGLMRHLAARSVPCPDPVADRGGRLLGELNRKPAALVTRLPGASCLRPTSRQCARVGALLARMHVAAGDYAGACPNPRGLDWQRAHAPAVAGFLGREAASLLDDELRAQVAYAASGARARLPSGPVHADLFRDNVLFDGEAVGGVVDFYFAGTDAWLFDLAVVCNDWCIDEGSGELDPERLAPLLRAYASERPFTGEEGGAWPTMLRAAALRFWISRLHDLHLPRPAEMVTPKDPAHFERVLRRRREGGAPGLFG